MYILLKDHNEVLKYHVRVAIKILFCLICEFTGFEMQETSPLPLQRFLYNRKKVNVEKGEQ